MAGYGAGDLIQTGGAFRLSNVYIGAYYAGNVFGSFSSSERSAETEVLNAASTNISAGTTDGQNTYGLITPNDTFKLLVGFYNMGVRLGFVDTLASKKSHDSAAFIDADGAKSGTRYDDFSLRRGSLTPSLDWGAKFRLGALVLKPLVGVDVGIYQNTVSYKESLYRTTAAYKGLKPESVIWRGGPSASETPYPYSPSGSPDVAASGDQVNLTFRLNADVDLPKKDGAQMSVGLGWTGSFRFYGSDYEDVDGAHVVAGAAAWEVIEDTDPDSYTYGKKSESSAVLYEKTQSTNTVTATFTYSNDISPSLSFGVRTTLPFRFDAASSDLSLEHKKNYGSFGKSVTRTSGLEKTTATSFDLRPKLDFGLSYTAIPSRLVLHAGLSTSFGFTVVTTETERSDGTVSNRGTGIYSNAWKSDSSPTYRTLESRTDRSWATFSNAAALGFTLTLAPGVALDAVFTAGAGENVSITSFSFLLSMAL
jgi:hypothetical protein